MKLLQQIFLIKNIYVKQPATHILWSYGLILVLLILFWQPISLYVDSMSSPIDLKTFGIVVGSVYAYLLLRTVIRTIIVNFRLYQRGRVAAYVTSASSIRSIEHELGSDHQTHAFESGDKYSIFTAIFEYNTRSRDRSDFHYFYTVFEAQLARRLPHVLFDSISAKRRQFKYLYLKAQKTSVQGNFDVYFDTYVPGTYHIDTLSFVTPEVMEALLAAKDYDIEIIGDRLLLYAPMISRREIARMRDLGLHIARHLDDNIDTYRDNRLSGAQRLQNVAPFGRQLLKSSFKYEVAAAALLLLTAVSIYFGITISPDILVNQISIIVYAGLVANVARIIQIRRHNRKMLRQYYYLHKTDRGKPLPQAD